MRARPTSFLAIYESMEKAEKLAAKEGWTEGESLADFIDLHDGGVDLARKFCTQDAAVAWLKTEINAMKSVFGMGEIITVEAVSPQERCRYCICQGSRRVARVTVDDEGLTGDDADHFDDCHN
jgi:hypothetical protein